MSLAWLISVIGSVAVGGLLVIALLRYPQNKTANRLFAAVIFFGLIIQFLYALKGGGFIFAYPMAVRARVPLQFLQMGLFYHYVRSLTGLPIVLNRQTLVHFLPFLLAALWYPAPLVWPALIAEGTVFWRAQWINVFLLQVFCAGYFISCYHRLKSYELDLKDFVSQPQELTIRWLRLLLSMIFVFWSLHTLELIMFFDPRITLLWRLSATAILCVAAGFALHYSQVFAEARQFHADDYAKGLSHDSLEQYRQALVELFQNDRPYLNAQLKLSDLAEQMHLKPYQVSQVLNRGLSTNFYDFVNRHRVEEARSRLEDPTFDHISIEGIAADSGFNSKSSFAVAFKRWAGKTPSAVRAHRSTPSR